MEAEIKTTQDEPEREPDAAFTQEIDGRPYRVRVFFPKDGSETLQQMIESLIRMEFTSVVEGSTE